MQGATDPEALADLARGELRNKLADLRQALTGRFRAHHAFLSRSSSPTWTTWMRPSPP